jgi:hypothetical protein
VRSCASELWVHQDKPTELYINNSGAEMLAKERKVTTSSCHIIRRFLQVREYVADDIVAVHRVATTDKPANMFTKPLDRAVFNKHTSKLMYMGVANGREGSA